MAELEKSCATCGWFARKEFGGDESLDLGYCENVSSPFEGILIDEDNNCHHWQSPEILGANK